MNIRSVPDLISWEKEDWESFINKEEIPLPTNVTSTKTYAENIKFNIERSYPTQNLLAHVEESNKVSSADSSLIKTTINHIKTFNINNPELDLRLLNLFDTENAKVKLGWHTSNRQT